jgi:putative phosphoesterase
VAIIADTHLPRGSRALPEECVSLLREAELVLHAGDFVTVAALQDLREIGPPVEGIHGNMDEPELKQLLPNQRVLDVGDVRIGMVHNPGPRNGRETRLAAKFADCQAVVYGHTHVPQVERFEDVWILNPGSPTERRTAPIHAMLTLGVEGTEITPELVTL